MPSQAIPVSPSSREADSRWKGHLGDILRSNYFPLITPPEMLELLRAKGATPGGFEPVGQVNELLCELAHARYIEKTGKGRFRTLPPASPPRAPAPHFHQVAWPTVVASTAPHAPMQQALPVVPQTPPPQLPTLQVVAPPKPTLLEVVFSLMTDLVLRQRTFVVEKLIQSLAQKELGGHIHIKDIGNVMYAFSQQHNLIKWKRDIGITGETKGYTIAGGQAPDGSWIRVG